VKFKQAYSPIPGGLHFRSREAVLARIDLRKQVIIQFLSEDLNTLCDQINQNNFEKDLEKYKRFEESNETHSGSFYDKVFDLMKSMNAQMGTVTSSKEKKQMIATRANGKRKHGSFVVDAHVYTERVEMLRLESQ
jgi:hypothetical protein